MPSTSALLMAHSAAAEGFQLPASATEGFAAPDGFRLPDGFTAVAANMPGLSNEIMQRAQMQVSL